MKNKIFLYDLSGKNGIRFSPPCWNVKLCFIHNNIDFDTIPIRFTEKNKLSFSDHKLVPIVRYNEEVIYDSWKIFLWLNNKIKQIKLIPNDQTKIFSHYLYFWTSKTLLPIIFKLIANDIPNILDEKDKQYFIQTREKIIKTTLKSLLIDKEKTKKRLFQSLIMFEKILTDNKFLNGNAPGLPDFIFFGNFIWAEKCSSENLFENLPNINKWYLNLKKINKLH